MGLEECRSRLNEEIQRAQMMEGEVLAKEAQLGYLQHSKKVLEARINLAIERICALVEAERKHQQKRDQSFVEGAERREATFKDFISRMDSLHKARSQELEAAMAAPHVSPSKYRALVETLEEELVQAAGAPSGNRVVRSTKDIKRQLELLEQQERKSQEHLTQRVSDQFKSAAETHGQMLHHLLEQWEAAEGSVRRSLEAELHNMHGEREMLECELEALIERLRPIDEQMAEVRSESTSVQLTLEVQKKNNTRIQKLLSKSEELLSINIDLQAQVLQRMRERMDDTSMQKLLEIQASIEERVGSCAKTRVDVEKQVMAIDTFTKCIHESVQKLQHRPVDIFDERVVEQAVLDYYKQQVGLDIRNPLGDSHNFRVILEFVGGELEVGNAVVNRVLKRHSLAELIVPLGEEDASDPQALAKKEKTLIKAFEDAVRSESDSDNPECQRTKRRVMRLKTRVWKCNKKVQEAQEKLKSAKSQGAAEEKLEKLETILERLEEEEEKVTEELNDAQEKVEEAHAELSEENRDCVRLMKAATKSVNKAAYMKAQDWELQTALWHLKMLDESLLAPVQHLQESAQRQEAVL